ncbi:hypothetical protein CQA75_04150 [Campylobacter taeniopygiae]|uniref:Uncharacterized protein n=1 Tax=Campylobacter taeniopygiae TaxID=2510188 RepID=A0ABY2TJ12_9BACT|nr:hypothetical protein CQA75_04150 [Campylobacter taeniopygiae]
MNYKTRCKQKKYWRKKQRLKILKSGIVLVILSTIALFDTLFNIKITGDMLRECEYVDDIISLAGDMYRRINYV